jgi:predicted nucleic acid-binding protein
MANDIFVDTSGFYALLIKADDRHVTATRQLRYAQRRKRRFVTSDYVLDETATFFEKVLASRVCRIESTDPERFHAVQAFFLKHADQAWSFTDCVSFCVMTEFRLRDALTKDGHFHEAGFVVLLK